MHLWIKIGTPILVLTLVAAGALSQGPWYWPLIMIFLGAVTIYFTRQSLAPLDDVARVVEGIANGNLDHEAIREQRNDEIGSLARSTNRMIRQLRDISSKAEEIAQGRIGVVDVEDQVMRSGRLYDADLATQSSHGDLERNFISLTNQMRRLTIQARVIAQDNLHSPLLDERIPGELGDSFALMVRNLRTIAERAQDIAGGDLTSYVDGDGDLTSAFNQMVTGLNHLIQQIIETAIHISTASEEILVVLQDQELAASHQASGVEETQRTMETLLSSARKIAESTQTVFKSAEKTQANNRIVADRIGELKAHTARIAEILEIIKSIADRSDLLALNASLEGMRAGEAGKGFTLVAAEMRRLAENIKESIGDIKELVSDIRESSLASVMSTEEGSRLSEQTTDTALKISLITQQQQSGTEQVTQSMEELSHLINQGVAGTRQVTTAARELAAASEILRTVVDNFQVGGQGEILASPTVAKKRRLPQKANRRGPQAATIDLGNNTMATLSRSLRFAENARKPHQTPISREMEVPPSTDAKDTGEVLGADEEAEPKKSSPAEKNGKQADKGAQSLEAPTVEFSAALTEDEKFFQDIAASRARSRDPESSQEFESIARQIEGADEDEEESESS